MNKHLPLIPLKKIKKGRRCYICGNRRNLQRHHRIFKCNGGLDTPGNLIVLCEKCHEQVHSSNKINPTDKYWVERIERLRTKQNVWN